MPEARVQQVQHGVLHTADVQVDAAGIARTVGLRARTHPVGLVLLGAERLRVRGVHVAQLVPGATGPLRHDVRVAGVVLQAIPEIQLDVQPVGGLRQRGRGLRVRVLRIEGHGRVVLDLREQHGQLGFRQGVRRTVGVEDDGEGLAPVPLAREQPVAQLVLHGAPAGAGLLQVRDDGGLRLRDAEAVDVQVGVRRVHRGALADVGLVRDAGLAAHHLDDGQAELRGELVVAHVVAGDCHDRAGAVAHQHVVADEDGDLGAAQRVHREGAQEDARLLLALLALQIGLGGDRRAVRGHGLGGGAGAAGPALVRPGGPGVGGQLIDQRMLGGEHHVGGAEQGVGAGGEDLDPLTGGGEGHAGAAAASDPVALHGLDLLGPVQHIQVVDQAVRVGGDPHHPLPQLFAVHGEVAALAATVGGDLLVGEHGAQSGAPVHQ